jgi:hypothetical protein
LLSATRDARRFILCGEAFGLFPGNLEAGAGAITVAIRGSAAFISLARFTGQPVRAGRRAMSVILMIAGCRARIRGATRPVTGRCQLRGITRWGWSRNRAGLDGLGRIPFDQKEKETLWLT